MSLDLSVVIPIFSEEENIEALHQRLSSVLGSTDKDYEIIFVNDCSRDGSLELMRQLSQGDPRVKVVSLSRNFGHQIAISAGMQFARGRSVVVMDGDLQDPPEVLPDLIERQEQGNWDIVYAVRKKRKEPLLIRALYYTYYRMLKWTSYIEIPLDAGDFCIMSRRVVDAINAMPERNRFVRGLRSWVGFRHVGIEYERAARGGGAPKYTFRALLKLALDGIVSFSFLPLRISTWVGLIFSSAGLLYALIIVFRRLRGDFETLGGWPTVVVSVLVLGGIQLIMLGIIGEYLGRIFEEIKGRPMYIVDELIGIEEDRT